MGTRSGPPPSDTDRILLDVLRAVADVRGDDVSELAPIYDFIDPTALERFLGSTTVPTTVTFEVYGCRVEVDGDGNVTATEATDGV
jgi:hypothetical protein